MGAFSLSQEQQQALDTHVRGAFQNALEKYTMPKLLDMPQFQNYAREVVNDIYDSLDQVSLPETIQHFKNSAKNKHDYRGAMHSPQASRKPDRLQEGLDNIPKVSTATPEDLSPRKNQSPSHNIPLMDTPQVGAQRQQTGEAATQHVPDHVAGGKIDPSMRGVGGVDETIARHNEPPQRGAMMQRLNALRYRRPLKKIERSRTVTARKQKKLQKHLTNLERQAKPLSALAFTLKRTLNLITIVMVVLIALGVLLCCTIIGIKLGVPLIGATIAYGTRLRTPIKQQLKRIERKLSPLQMRIKGTKRGLSILQKRLTKLAREERQLRNAGLFGRTDKGNLGQQTPTTA